MVKELKPIDVESIEELARLMDKARTANSPLILQRDGEDVAVITPLRKQSSTRRQKVREPKPITDDAPLWNIIGIAGSDPDGPTDVSSNKKKYLAEAYADLHEKK